MQNRWLPFLIIGFFSIIVLLFFTIRLRPIDLSRQQTEQLSILTEPSVTFVNPSKGSKEAKIQIIVFSDFGCDACSLVLPALDAAVKAYPEDVRVVWKNLPNTSAHPEATSAAIAAHCADRQGAFWAYHDLLFERRSFLSKDQFVQIAKELSLDLKRFTSCIEKKDTLPIIEKDVEEAQAIKLIATPTLFVGKEKIVGSISVQELNQLIQEQIAATP